MLSVSLLTSSGSQAVFLEFPCWSWAQVLPLVPLAPVLSLPRPGCPCLPGGAQQGQTDPQLPSSSRARQRLSLSFSLFTSLSNVVWSWRASSRSAASWSFPKSNTSCITWTSSPMQDCAAIIPPISLRRSWEKAVAIHHIFNSQEGAAAPQRPPPPCQGAPLHNPSQQGQTQPCLPLPGSVQGCYNPLNRRLAREGSSYRRCLMT